MLPPTILIKDLAEMFESVLRDNNKTRRNNQVVKNLLKSENIQVNLSTFSIFVHSQNFAFVFFLFFLVKVREQQIKARAPLIKIEEDRICPVCKRMLGLSAFARYPNGVTVHFVCCRDRSVCPVTGTNFKDAK